MSEQLTIDRIMTEAYSNSAAHGWYDDGRLDVKRIPEEIALIHSEVSEAFEHYRNYGDPDREIKEIFYTGPTNAKPDGFAVELADAVIRICDVCEARGVPLSRALREKMAYNRTRPYRHGNKNC